MKTAMDFKSHFTVLKNALEAHRNLWEVEVLNGYPETLLEYPEDWLEYLNKLNQKQLWQLDNEMDTSALPNNDFLNFVVKLKKMTTLNSFETNNDLQHIPKRAYFKINQKKKHEISQLIGLLDKYQIVNSFSKMTDIGGGIGHTSRLFSHFNGMESTCIEKDQKLIRIGKEKFKHIKVPKDGKPFSYAHLEFGIDISKEKPHFNKDTFSLGLHTCGPLSNRHFDSHLKHGGGALLNFGCCYIKLENKKDQNISTFAKQEPIYFEKYALTLATRSHAEMSYADFQIKERVKSFRYTLHLFLYEKENKTKFIGLGNTPLKIYE